MGSLTSVKQAEILSKKLGVSKRRAQEIVDETHKMYLDALITGNKIRIDDVGNIVPVVRKARTYRNPKTGAPVIKGDRWSLKIDEYPSLKKLINDELPLPSDK